MSFTLASLFKGKKPRSQETTENALRKIFQKAPDAKATNLPEMFHVSAKLDPIDIISSMIAETPFNLYNRREYRAKGKEAKPIIVDEIFDLLDMPLKSYPELDGYALIYITESLYELTGDGFIYKLRDGRNISDLYPIPKSWISNVPSQAKPFFEINMFKEQSIEVNPADMIWFKQPNMSDPYGLGRGRAESVGDEVETDQLAAKYAKNVFYNDGTPPFILFAPDAQKEDIERIQGQWAEKYGGWINNKKPAVLPWRDGKVQSLALAPRELDMVESRKSYRDMLLQHWRIPPEIYGVIENSNRSTIDASYYLMHKNVLSNRLRFYERVLTTQLIRCDFNADLCLVFDEKIPEDEEFKLKKVTTGVERGLVTRAEWRRSMGMPVDEKKDDVYVVPFSLMEVPADQPIGGMRATGNAGEPEPIDSTGDTSTGDEGDEGKAVITIVDKKKKGFSDAQKRKIWELADIKAVSHEQSFVNGVKSFSSAQKSRLNRAFLDAMESTDDVAQAIESALRATFGKDADMALLHKLASSWMETVTEGFNLAKEILGTNPNFRMYKEIFNTWIDTKGLDKCKTINATTDNMLKELCKRSLVEGFAAGENTAKLAARIKEQFDYVYENLSEARSQLIARTETMSSLNFGQYATYKGEGVKYKEWISTPDDVTRETHRSEDMAEPVVKIDEAFTLTDGDRLMYPGDSSGSASNVCNCRCTIAPLIEEEE